ncbi:hypothetical protein RV10_GL000225 [Enterococcus pallens]|nr:hypothetical protein RV10_GL000225 [Enterococcus pallens]
MVERGIVYWTSPYITHSGDSRQMKISVLHTKMNDSGIQKHRHHVKNAQDE